MASDNPMPELSYLGVELERPRGEEHYERPDDDAAHGGDVVGIEAQHERRGEEPQATAEVQPLATHVIAAEAEVREERQGKPDEGGVGGRHVVCGVVRDP